MTEDDDRIAQVPRAYALRICNLARLNDGSDIGRRVIAAFESVPREQFVGPPPWRIISPQGHHQGVTSNPEDLYHDVLVSLDAGRGLNNGQPSLHALCLGALAPSEGERCVHVGAGTGYYTAILATLVGEAGRVDAYEIEPELAARAAANLAGFPQAQVHARSGAEAPIPECDVLYVSAASAEPLDVWLDALRFGGRLLFPLEAEGEGGEMLLLTRDAERSYAARFLCGVKFVSCVGAQNQSVASALLAAFRRGNSKAVRRLYRNNLLDESCWCAGNGWWLSTT